MTNEEKKMEQARKACIEQAKEKVKTGKVAKVILCPESDVNTIIDNYPRSTLTTQINSIIIPGDSRQKMIEIFEMLKDIDKNNKVSFEIIEKISIILKIDKNQFNSYNDVQHIIICSTSDKDKEKEKEKDRNDFVLKEIEHFNSRDEMLKFLTTVKEELNGKEVPYDEYKTAIVVIEKY
jgi:hypothetical protein